MERKDIPIADNKFEHNGKSYDCSHLIKRDKKAILREADADHGDTFDTLYDRDTLEPVKVKAYLDDSGAIVYLMIVYRIRYRVGDVHRTACGEWYPFCELRDGVLFESSLYAGSICW